ncbi:hypothetical protein BC834DRAFT_803806, partial [Gloeopeniophorella convolvens]
MNYENYERRIVERVGVHLAGWPLSIPIRNPGTLSRDNALILQNTLDAGTCRWEKLSAEELEARKAENRHREENGEQVYKPSKPQT